MTGTTVGEGEPRWTLAVDIGTTFTAAATRRGDTVQRVPFGSGAYLPSVVCVDDQGEFLTGPEAVAEAVLHPERAERLPKKVLAEGERTRLASRTVSTASLVAAILRRVAAEARRRHRDTAPQRVVLTHPALWHETGPEVARLRRAAHEAGLGEVELVAEPVAAARHYAGTSRTDGVVAVYDLGGGTFDAAVLHPVESGFTLAGPAGGDAHLGGEDFDAALMEVVEGHARATDADAWTLVWEDSGKRADRDRSLLRQEITAAKETLSERTAVGVYVPGLDHEVRVTRAEYEAAIEPLVSATLEHLDDTLARAGIGPEDVHALYLTGSASRTPLISAMLTRRHGVLPVTQDDPKAVVAQGALADPESADDAPTPDVVPAPDADHQPAARPPAPRARALWSPNGRCPDTRPRVLAFTGIALGLLLLLLTGINHDVYPILGEGSDPNGAIAVAGVVVALTLLGSVVWLVRTRQRRWAIGLVLAGAVNVTMPHLSYTFHDTVIVTLCTAVAATYCARRRWRLLALLWVLAALLSALNAGARFADLYRPEVPLAGLYLPLEALLLAMALLALRRVNRTDGTTTHPKVEGPPSRSVEAAWGWWAAAAGLGGVVAIGTLLQVALINTALTDYLDYFLRYRVNEGRIVAFGEVALVDGAVAGLILVVAQLACVFFLWRGTPWARWAVPVAGLVALAAAVARFPVATVYPVSDLRWQFEGTPTNVVLVTQVVLLVIALVIHVVRWRRETLSRGPEAAEVSWRAAVARTAHEPLGRGVAADAKDASPARASGRGARR